MNDPRWVRVRAHDTLLGVPKKDGPPEEEKVVPPGAYTELPIKAARRLAAKGDVTIISTTETP